MTLQSDSPSYAEFANLGRLVNLCKLEVSFVFSDYRHRNEQAINVDLMLRPLAKLSKLVDLDFSSTIKTSFASLSFVKIAPILQRLRLSVRESENLGSAIASCPSTLQELNITSYETPLRDYECTLIPWATIKKVSLSSSRDSMCKRGLFDGLEKALYPITVGPTCLSLRC